MAGSGFDLYGVYTKFVQQLMERYPWVTKYTIINEALVTTMFCGEFGIWYPFKKGKKSFYQMLLPVATAIRDISVLLEKKGIQHWLMDSCDWDTLVTRPNRRIDPQGIFSLDEQFNRHSSEFSNTIAAIAAGKISSKDIPAYRFRPPLSVQMKGFIAGPMQQYAWKEPLPTVPVHQKEEQVISKKLIYENCLRDN